jgi:hypothetical protein
MLSVPCAVPAEFLYARGPAAERRRSRSRFYIPGAAAMHEIGERLELGREEVGSLSMLKG